MKKKPLSFSNEKKKCPSTFCTLCTLHDVGRELMLAYCVNVKSIFQRQGIQMRYFFQHHSDCCQFVVYNKCARVRSCNFASFFILFSCLYTEHILHRPKQFSCKKNKTNKINQPRICYKYLQSSGI